MSVSSRHTVPPHALVRASAGSGKTFRLTNVLLDLLLSGEDPGAILATTFTRSAAGEIRDRMLARLSDAVLDEDARAELDRHTEADASAEACAAALERVIASSHRLSILTIDALLARLAGSFGLELGLPPGWAMLDEQAEEAARERAVERALDEASPLVDHELLRELHGGKLSSDTHGAVLRAVAQAYSVFLECREASLWEAIGPAGRRLEDAALDEAIDALGELELPLTKAGKPDANWRKAHEAAIEQCAERAWDQLASKGIAAKVLLGETAFRRHEISDAFLEAYRPLVEHARHELTQRHAARTRAVRALAERFHAAYRAVKRSLGAATFDDPPALLLESGLAGETERMYYRLDARVRHLLLDEFQDTSMLQFRLLEPMLGELLSGGEDGRRVFCVGDSKQSLYGWRQAEPELLEAMDHRFEAFRPETLSSSYRSSPAVIDAVNEIFLGLAYNPLTRRDDAIASAAQRWDEAFEPHTSRRPDLPGLARLIVCRAPNEEEAAVSASQAAASAIRHETAEMVGGILRDAPGASVAVLCRAGKHIAPLLAELRALGIDASEQRGNPLTDTPALAAAASALRFIDHPGDTAALYHTLMTPLGRAAGFPHAAGWSPESEPETLDRARRRASELRRRIADRGLGPLVAEWYESCVEHLDAAGAERFERLVEMADRLDASGDGGAGTLADLAESRRVDAPGGSPVRVMTIHASKGLEFDAVVLPLFPQRSHPNVGRVLLDREDAIGPVRGVTLEPNTDLCRVHSDLERVKSDARRRDLREELCCLYVACTRAKRRLDLIVPPDKDGTPPNFQNRAYSPDLLVRAALALEATAEPGTVLWSTTHPGPDDDPTTPSLSHAEAQHAPRAWSEGLSGPSDVRPPPRRPVVLRVEAGPGRGRGDPARLTTITPSRARGAAAIDARELLLRRDDRAARTGSLVHAWFESVGWIEDGEPDRDTLRAGALREGFTEQEIDDALPLFERALRSPEVRGALSRDACRREHEAERLELHRERQFAVAAGDELIQGRFDRVVVWATGGSPVALRVIDFKTDRAAADADPETMNALADSHRSQMDIYRSAAATLWSLPHERVEAQLVFTAGVVLG